MSKKDGFTKFLAVAGTALAWFPLLAPVLLALASLVAAGRLHFDTLMPAELFLFALAGGGLLLGAAVRLRLWRGLIGGGLGAAVGLLAGSQGLAVVTGLASGAHPAEGWRLAVVVLALALYTLSLLAVGLGGILLLRRLYRRESRG